MYQLDSFPEISNAIINHSFIFLWQNLRGIFLFKNVLYPVTKTEPAFTINNGV